VTLPCRRVASLQGYDQPSPLIPFDSSLSNTIWNTDFKKIWGEKKEERLPTSIKITERDVVDGT
jgi:hypothetical protein